MRRMIPAAAILIGGRILFGNFLITAARNESIFDYLSTPIGLCLVLGGGYFLLKDYE